jgi:hypothetical protein
MAKGKPCASLDTAKLAAKTKDFSGADLKAVFDVTIERLMEGGDARWARGPAEHGRTSRERETGQTEHARLV